MMQTDSAAPAGSPNTLAPLRVMHAVRALASAPEGLSLAQLSTELGVPKSSLLSLLRTLASGGFVEASDAAWRLGQESFALGTLITRSRPFPDNVRPLLADLQRACEQTVLLTVPSEDWQDIVYVDLIESQQMLRFKVAVGSRDPIYCTALGLAMLAFAPAPARDHYVRTVRLVPRTRGTITSRDELQRFVRSVRSKAISIHSGINENVTAIAAPVFSSAGNVVAAVGLAGISADIKRGQDALVQQVRETGAAMSYRLGCSDYPPEI